MSATGETRNRTVSRRGFPAGGRRANSCRISTFFRVDRSSLPREGRSTGRVQLDLVGADGDVGVRQLAELPDLRVREGRLGRATSAEEVDLLDAAPGERLQRVIGDVGFGQLLGRAAQDPGHVHGDVAHADDGYPFLGEIELAVAIIGMAVVPGDELGGRVAVLQIFPGDAHAPIRLRPRGIDDLVIVVAQLVDSDVAAELHAPEEAKPRVRGDLVEGNRDVLDLLVVGRNAQAHEPIRGRQTVEHVHLDDDPVLAQELVGGVVPGRPGTHDGDPKRSLRRARARRHAGLWPAA